MCFMPSTCKIPIKLMYFPDYDFPMFQYLIMLCSSCYLSRYNLTKYVVSTGLPFKYIFLEFGYNGFVIDETEYTVLQQGECI